MVDKVMLFPGQGTQYIGMGRALYKDYPVVRETYEEAGDILGFNIANLCFNGPTETLNKTENAQVAIVTTSVAAFRQFKRMYLDSPVFSAGHSLGEYSALVCAEAASFAEILQLVRYRGELMAEAAQREEGAMIAVEGLEPAVVAQLCEQARELGGAVWIGAYNTPLQVVISGRSQSVGQVAAQCERKGARIIPLTVAGAFHTPMMANAADALQEWLNKIRWRLPVFPVISNVTAFPYQAVNELPIQLASQMVMPVLWSDTLNVILNSGPKDVLAFPPKNIMVNMIQSKDTRVFSFQSRDELKKYGEQTQTGEIEETLSQSSEIDLIAHMLAIAVSTKNNSDDQQDYEARAIYPYRCLEDIHTAYLAGKPLTNVLKDQAFEWLDSILTAKKVGEPKKSEILLELRRLG